MKNRINKKVSNLGLSKMREISELSNKYEDTINLTLGEPCFDANKKIKSGVIEILKQGTSKYSKAGGEDNIRNEILKYIDTNFKLNYNLDEIIVTNGASMGLTVALKTIINEFDEVIVISPYYPSYKSLIEMFGGKCVEVYSNNYFQIDFNLLEEKISSLTKAIIINYPQNPTGVSLTYDNQKRLVSFVNKYSLFLLSDEVYNTVRYNDSFVTMGIYKEIKDKLIIVNSFSKSHSIPGYRIGYLLGSEDMIRYMKIVNQNLSSSVSYLSQYSLLNINDIDTNYMIDFYKSNLNIAKEILDENNIKYIDPDGTFYLFININTSNMDCDTFCIKLLNNHKVSVVPGTAFGDKYTDYIRISYACDKGSLIKGIKELIKLILK